jgi:hypothetical protein
MPHDIDQHDNREPQRQQAQRPPDQAAAAFTADAWGNDGGEERPGDHASEPLLRVRWRRRWPSDDPGRNRFLDKMTKRKIW